MADDGKTAFDDAINVVSDALDNVFDVELISRAWKLTTRAMRIIRAENRVYNGRRASGMEE